MQQKDISRIELARYLICPSLFVMLILMIAEAMLTGFFDPKAGGFFDTRVAAGEASNALFRGAVAQTGEATALVVSTGRATITS